MAAVRDLASDVGIVAACEALAVPRASYYRTLRPPRVVTPRPTPAREQGVQAAAPRVSKGFRPQPRA